MSLRVREFVGSIVKSGRDDPGASDGLDHDFVIAVF
jgi:hypothetical protein